MKHGEAELVKLHHYHLENEPLELQTASSLWVNISGTAFIEPPYTPERALDCSCTPGSGLNSENLPSAPLLAATEDIWRVAIPEAQAESDKYLTGGPENVTSGSAIRNRSSEPPTGRKNPSGQ